MGKIKSAPAPIALSLQARIVAVLIRDNPALRVDFATIYADAIIDYLAASENIRDNGSVVLHPRTGAPIDNPYLRVRVSAIAQMAAAKGVRVVIGAWDCARGGGA
jgi:phage terminase small subunit